MTHTPLIEKLLAKSDAGINGYIHAANSIETIRAHLASPDVIKLVADEIYGLGVTESDALLVAKAAIEAIMGDASQEELRNQSANNAGAERTSPAKCTCYTKEPKPPSDEMKGGGK